MQNKSLFSALDCDRRCFFNKKNSNLTTSFVSRRLLISHRDETRPPPTVQHNASRSIAQLSQMMLLICFLFPNNDEKSDIKGKQSCDRAAQSAIGTTFISIAIMRSPFRVPSVPLAHTSSHPRKAALFAFGKLKSISVNSTCSSVRSA